jgi:uncharacterized protein HemX
MNKLKALAFLVLVSSAPAALADNGYYYEKQQQEIYQQQQRQREIEQHRWLREQHQRNEVNQMQIRRAQQNTLRDSFSAPCYYNCK